MEIIPAILPKDFRDLEKHADIVAGAAALVQVDVCDGQFTPNPSWPYRKQDDNFAAIVKEDRGMPFWETIEYEFDLMLNRPEERIEDFISAGAARIVLHAESKGKLAEAVESLAGRVEVGLALNIETPLDAIEPFKDKIQYVQLMGIDKVGFQGQAFDEQVIGKIKAVKAKYPDLLVQVDGGVNLETAPLLQEAGADRLVVGSALFDSENPLETLEELKMV